MKVKHAWVALVLVMAQAGAAEVATRPSAAQVEAATWTWRVLERYRYKPQGPEKPAGAPQLESYLDLLDPERMVFTQADLREFDGYRARIEKNGAPPALEDGFALFHQYRPRLLALLDRARDQLHQPMSFDGTGRYRRARTQAPRAAGEAELRQLWRQRVMDDVLSLRVAGCPEADIVPTLARRYDKYRDRLDAMTSRDVFELFMNAYTRSLDPDGRYYAPPSGSSKGGGSLAGVGLIVRKKDEQIEVIGIAQGSAAARSGQLKQGDRIVGFVTQPDQPAKGVIGWHVDDVVELLRGAPGSSVVFEVVPAGAPADAARRRISLVRDMTAADTRGLQADEVQSRIEQARRGSTTYRLGVIEVPPLYDEALTLRAGDQRMQGASGYVARQLQALKQSGADAIVLDLRNNGGGALKEAVRLAGLFLPGEAIVQQLSFDGKLTVDKAPEGVAAWDGPLAILVDKGTGAGAEIVAAALQDHGRALVLGDPSHGRSTVQTVISLDRFASMPLGRLSMTVSQAFRIDGSHVEGSGVAPDLALPGAPDAGPGVARHGGYPAARQAAAGARKAETLAALLPDLRARHAARTAGDRRYQAMLAARTQALEQQRTGEVTLDDAERRRERDAQPSADIKLVQRDEALQVLADALDLVRASRP